jgi:Zn-dependent alcohol dehydrogenase
MSALHGAVNAGARRVFAIEPAEWKHDLALEFGATYAYSTVEAALPEITELTAGRMPQGHRHREQDQRCRHLELPGTDRQGRYVCADCDGRVCWNPK